MVDHRYSTFDIRLYAFKASLVGGKLQTRDHEEVRWVPLGKLSTMDLNPANVEIGKT
jgi:hypothetical protein